jgi:HlyD family secretion protein
MSLSHPQLAVTGAAMDTVVPKRRGRQAATLAIAAVALLAVGAIAWQSIPKGLVVETRDIHTATVTSGPFLDNIVVRSNAEPLQSVLLDSVESGRVEEVFITDGTMVKEGQLLFRLSNPQRNLELLARQAEHAQQISNLSNLRVAQEDSIAAHARRVEEIEYALLQQKKQYARSERLAGQGFLSAVALEESKDQLIQQQKNLKQENDSFYTASQVRHTALAQLSNAINELDSGLTLINETVKALAVRAPVAGRLTGFRLQVGETVKTDQHIGRIDDPTHFKMVGQVDEFYLNRVSVGQRGELSAADKTYPLKVSTIYPQVKDGRFTVELVFGATPPSTISPGQSFDMQITLGDPKQALLLPMGAFVNETGGGWVYVVDPDGSTATRRPIKTGRRNVSQIEVLSGMSKGEKAITSSYAKFGKSEVLQLSD